MKKMTQKKRRPKKKKKKKEIQMNLLIKQKQTHGLQKQTQSYQREKVWGYNLGIWN